jgi:hypothetical protein
MSRHSDINWAETCHILRYKAGLLQDVGSALTVKLRAPFISKVHSPLLESGPQINQECIPLL